MQFKIDPRANQIAEAAEQGGFPGLAAEIRALLSTGRVPEPVASAADEQDDEPRVLVTDPEPFTSDEQFDIALDILIAGTVGRVRLLEEAEAKLKSVSKNFTARISEWANAEDGAIPVLTDDAIPVARKLEHLLELARNARTLNVPLLPGS